MTPDDVLKCPRGKRLKPGRRIKHSRFFTSRARDCRGCDLAALCLLKGRTNKAVSNDIRNPASGDTENPTIPVTPTPRPEPVRCWA